METPDVGREATASGSRLVNRWRFQFLLPVRFNPDDPIALGGEVQAEHFVAVQDALIAQFGGFSVFGGPGAPVIRGLWRDEQRAYVDEHYLYEVVTERLPEHEHFFLSFHAMLLTRFRQREVFMLVEDIRLVLRASE